MKLTKAGALLFGMAMIIASASAQELKWRASSPRVETTEPPAQTTAPGDSAIAPAAFQIPMPFKLRNRSEESPRILPAGPVLKSQTPEPGIIAVTPAQEPQVKDAAVPVLPEPEQIKTMPTQATPGGEIIEGDDTTTGSCRDCGPCGRWGGSWCRGFWNRDSCECGWESCHPRSAFWVSGEYLLYALRKPAVPPLVSNVTFPTPAGALTRPATTVLFDDDEWENPLRNGGRLRAGYWFERSCCWGIDVGGFMLERLRENYFAASPGVPTLGRPLIRADLAGLPDTQLVAFPGIVAGAINVDYSNLLWGVDANLRRKMWCNDRAHVDAFVGYRFINFEENVRIREDLVALAAPNFGFRVNDNFDVTNRFHGAQFGLDGEFHFGNDQRWFIGTGLKVAVGVNRMSVNIYGSQVITPPLPAVPVNAPFGVFALATNSGRTTQTQFAVAPEGNLKLGYELAENLRVWVGYDFLYISNVVRAPEQIDLTINRNNIPTFANPNPVPVAPFRPAVLFQTTDFWAQGLNAGLEYRY